MTLPLGELVKERRKRLGWTQAELAERIGVDRSYLSMIETGARKWPRDVVPDLSDALGISQIDMAVAAGLIEPPPAADQNPVALVDPRLTNCKRPAHDRAGRGLLRPKRKRRPEGRRSRQ